MQAEAKVCGSELQQALQNARGELESDDVARLDAAIQQVEQATHKMAEVLYKTQGAEGGEAPGAGAGAGAAGGESAQADDQVIDAEYTEEKGDQ